MTAFASMISCFTILMRALKQSSNLSVTQQTILMFLISKLKRRADLALIAQIKRQRDNIMITFSLKGSHMVKAADIIKQLAKTHFKATLGERDQQLTVRLVIQPKMTTSDWLNQLLKLVGGLADVIQNNHQAAEKMED